VPEVTVVIPTKDRWDLLERGLSTVLAQRDVDLEVIIVDDGSTAPAPAGSATLADPRVTMIRNETSLRGAGARNRGIRLARADWIAFLDDDDFWSPTKLTSQLQAAERDGADFVYCSAVIVDQGLNPLRLELAPGPAQLAAGIRTHAMIPAGTSSVVVRARLLDEIGGFNEQLLMVDDWDMWIRIATHGRGSVAPEVHVAYVEHADNMHMTDLAGLREVDHIVRTYSDGPAARRRAEMSAAKWRGRTHLRADRRRSAAREFLRVGLKYRDRAMLAQAARALVSQGAVEQARASLRDPNVAEPDWLKAHRAETQAAARGSAAGSA
jgi:glycosyltransferase involved in cell wall biosynthesis